MMDEMTMIGTPATRNKSGGGGGGVGKKEIPVTSGVPTEDIVRVGKLVSPVAEK